MTLAVPRARREAHLPRVGRAIRGSRPAERSALAGFLPLEAPAKVGAEHPEVPRVLLWLSLLLLPIVGKGDLEPAADRGLGDIAHQAQLQRRGDALAGFVRRGGLWRVVAERLLDTRKWPETDELQRVFRATAAVALRRDQNVDVGVAPVAHVIDKRDLAPDVVLVAVVAAVEKDPDVVGTWRRSLRPGAAREREQDDAEAGETHFSVRRSQSPSSWVDTQDLERSAVTPATIIDRAETAPRAIHMHGWVIVARAASGAWSTSFHKSTGGPRSRRPPARARSSDANDAGVHGRGARAGRHQRAFLPAISFDGHRGVGDRPGAVGPPRLFGVRDAVCPGPGSSQRQSALSGARV